MDHVEMYGPEWIEETWKSFREIRQENFAMLANLVPMAQTPQTREGASAMKRAGRQIQQMIQRIAPWTKRERSDRLVSDELRKRIGSGNVVVMLESGERADLDVYKEANTLRD